MGYVEPYADIETLPLSPYFHLGWMKIMFEVFYVMIILYMLGTEMREVYDQRRFIKGKKNRTWKNALIKHYWTDEGSSGNCIDLVNVGIGIALCVEWLELVRHLRIIEIKMQDLHRPSGEVSYDDNDADVWSHYHHQIAEIEEVCDTLNIYDANESLLTTIYAHIISLTQNVITIENSDENRALLEHYNSKRSNIKKNLPSISRLPNDFLK